MPNQSSNVLEKPRFKPQTIRLMDQGRDELCRWMDNLK